MCAAIIAACAVAACAVKCVIAAKLVSHFVRDIINIKRVADRIWLACSAERLLSVTANNSHVRDTAAARGEDVTNVVIRRTDPGIQVRLIFAVALESLE